MNDGGNNKALNYPTLSGLSNITSDDIITTNLSTDTFNVLTINCGSITASDISSNTITAYTSVDTPALIGPGNLDLTYGGGIYAHSPEFNINTTGGYGGISLTSQFDIDLHPLSGEINLLGKVNQSLATRNVCYGTGALDATITSGADNCAIGINALQSLTSGQFNVAVGGNSGDSIVAGIYNTSVGYNSLTTNNSNANTSIGYEALKTFTGSNTTACGYQALGALTTGTVCSAFGAGCCGTTTTADAVSGFGFLCLNKCNGSHNSSYGFGTDSELVSGVGNCSFGSSSGCKSSSYNSQSGNSCFGYNVVSSGGSFNSYLGYYANSASPVNTSYSTAIGAFATPTASNQIMLGTASQYVQCPNYMDVAQYITTTTQPPLTNNTKVATTAYVDYAVSVVGGVSLSGANAWTGTNSFNVNLPTSTLTPSSGSELVTKTYADTKGGLGIFNTWTSANTFNSVLPSSSLAPTSANQLCNKTYVDTKGALGLPNTWTNTNTFNSFLPSSNKLPTTIHQLCNKQYVDGVATDINSYDAVVITDDFLDGYSNNPVQWTNTNFGSGQNYSRPSEALHPGLWRYQTTIFSNTGSGVAMTTSSIYTNSLLSVEWIWKYEVNYNSIDIQVGYANNFTTFTTSALFNFNGGAYYEAVVNGVSVYDFDKEPLLWGNNYNKWLHGKIIINFTAGTQTFQLTNLTDNKTDSYTHTAAITSTAITPILKITNTGGNVGYMVMDYCRIRFGSSRV